MNNTNNIQSFADNQNAAFGMQPVDLQSIKQGVANDIRTIENLVSTGRMTQEQGQNLVNYVTQKAFEQYTSGQTPVMPQQVQQPVQPQMMPQAPMQNAAVNPPEFFNRDGRSDVFDYLRNSNVTYDEDELSKISSLVEKIEKTGVDRYLKELEHEKTLNSENESAKQRLRANAQNSVSDGTKNTVFTREQIGKMSGAEFAKHERAIMEQLRKGLIR